MVVLFDLSYYEYLIHNNYMTKKTLILNYKELFLFL